MIKSQKSSKLHLVWIILGGLSVFYFFYIFQNKEDSHIDTNMIIDGDLFVLQVSKTEKQRIQGLSNKKELLPNTGMFFVFETEEKHGIWMKDMNFPIDILWLSKECKVVGIKNDATPDSFPTVFYPVSEALYVIEVPANTLEGRVFVDDELNCPQL